MQTARTETSFPELLLSSKKRAVLSLERPGFIWSMYHLGGSYWASEAREGVLDLTLGDKDKKEQEIAKNEVQQAAQA